jgi:hypothetical protein
MSKPKTKVIKVAKGVDSFFAKKDVIEHIIDKSIDKSLVESKKIEDDTCKKPKIVEEFYESLTPSEKIAHELAESMLGTSYDVMRTHGFLQWLKSKQEKKE